MYIVSATNKLQDGETHLATLLTIGRRMWFHISVSISGNHFREAQNENGSVDFRPRQLVQDPNPGSEINCFSKDRSFTGVTRLQGHTIQ